ncbi:hypothetical protein [Shewanella sp.]|uniref:hypothetical protein n=1 Tax=Shewanella sp. TaxID=50422 RepID=UPI0040542336
MYAQIDKSKENKSKAVANAVAKNKSVVQQSFAFVDNRSEVIAKRRYQEMVGNYCSPVSQINDVPPKQTESVIIQKVESNIIQRQVAGWPIRNLAADTEVYHNASAQNALNIIQNHIQPVANAFGGGQLGAGFYTYTVRASAELFGGNTTLKFRTTADSIGQEVPNAATWDNFGPYAQDALAGNNFLWTDEDPNQYKFHGGANLELISVFDVGTGTEYTPQEYLEMLGL